MLQVKNLCASKNTVHRVERKSTEWDKIPADQTCSRDCYCLNIKCLPQVRVLNTWSPTGGTILRGNGDFRKWDLAGESRSLPGPLSLPLSLLSALHEWTAFVTWSFCHDVWLCYRPKKHTQPSDHGLNPPKPWAKRSFLSLNCSLRYYVTVTKTKTKTKPNKPNRDYYPDNRKN
jgi:hypothetical protein